MARVWGWPLANRPNRRATFAKATVLGLSGGFLSTDPVGLNVLLTDDIKPMQKLFVGLSDYGFHTPPAQAEFARSITSPVGHGVRRLVTIPCRNRF
jgi:hypothetical protein